MNNLSIATIIEANRTNSEVPFLILLDIEVVNPTNGVVVTVLNVVRNTEAVTFKGTSYTPAMFDINIKAEVGKASEVNLSLKDYTQTLQALMEDYGGGVGSNVTMYIVNAGNLSQGAEYVEYFQIVGASSSEYTHNFTLGAENALMQTFPRRRQTRDFCQWRYKSNECGYGVLKVPYVKATDTSKSTRFRQDATPVVNTFCLSTYVQFDKSNAIYLIHNNLTKSFNRGATFTYDKKTDTISVVPVGSGTTFGYQRLGIGYYRVWVSNAIPAGESADTCYVYLYTARGAVVAVGDGLYPIGMQLEYGVATPSALELTTATAGVRNVLKYSCDFSNAIWVKGVVSIDTTVPPAFGPNVGAMASCDLSLQGPNGCAAHGNTVNFGGFPGLNANGYRYL